MNKALSSEGFFFDGVFYAFKTLVNNKLMWNRNRYELF